MIRMYNFPWSNGPSVPLHFERIGGFFLQLGSSFHNITRNASSLNFRSDLLYIIGHSNLRGIVIEENKNISPVVLSKLIAQANPYSPQLLFLNTCYGIESGLAQAAGDAGVKTVIAASGPIPIKHMTQYAEYFFQSWTEDEQSVSKTLEKVNQKFNEKKIQFTFLGNGRMTYSSLRKY